MMSLAWFLPLLLVATTVSAIKPCEIKRAEILEKLRENPGILGLHPPQCDEDGTYSAVQCREAVCFCSDDNGNQLKGYKFGVSKRSETACKCAREQYRLQHIIGKTIACDVIGNYASRQCTGSVCYCADVKKGTQIGKSVPIGKLSELNC